MQEGVNVLEELEGLGLSGPLLLRVASVCEREAGFAYKRGYRAGQCAQSDTLVGHAEISAYLGCSERSSQRLVKYLREVSLLVPGQRGKPPIVQKSVLDELLGGRLAELGGSGESTDIDGGRVEEDAAGKKRAAGVASVSVSSIRKP